MSMVGTFDSFTSARLGIYAAQHGLKVTGNNISNINTAGYTRQRVDQYSFKVGNNDLYRSFYDNHVGAGALVKSICQIRDPYLDIRYRNVSTDTYHYDTWLAGLQNIASILDEVGKGDNDGDGLIYKQLQDLAEKLRAYGNNPTELNERLVRNSATSLTALFHSAATNLENLYNETKAEFYDNIDAVNEILINIRDLDKSIRDAEIHGDAALEMRDERNRQIDALSQYLDIRVEYSYEDIGAGVQVEKLTIRLNNANPDSKIHTDESILVDGVYCTQLSVPDVRPVLNTYGDEPPETAYLKGYAYLREVATDDEDTINEFLAALKAKGINLTKDQLATTTKKDADGNEVEYFLIGTNDSDLDGVVMETNDNYSIQLSKLVNSKGELWKNTTTRWEEVAGTPINYPRYGFAVNGSGLSTEPGKNEFIINGITYIIVDDKYDGDDYADDPNTELVNIADIKGNDFADFVAKKLEASGKYKPDYSVSAKNGQIIFTATDPDSTAAAPTLTVTPDDGRITVSSVTVSDLVKYGPPDPASMADEGETLDEHGNVIQSIRYIESNGRYYRLQVNTEYTHEVALDDNDLRGILQAEREMLTEEGEFSSEKDLTIDENALLKRGIPYYIKSLDLLAQKFAEAYNQLNQGYAYNQDGYYIDENGNPLVLPDADGTERNVSIDGLTEGQKENLINNGYILKNKDGYAVDKKGNLITDKNGDPIKVNDDKPYIDQENYDKVVVDFDRWMTEHKAIPKGGVLFSNRGDNSDPTGITAANISISAGWSNGEWNVVPTYEMLFLNDGSGGLTNSTQPSNINHMIAMIEKSLTYDPRDLEGSDAIGPVLFQGSFNDMLSNMMSVEGEDASITNVRLTNSSIRLNEIDFSREGVSGVDLNDEAMNMVSYQKAMGAAMRLMTAIDEMLDRLINNTGIAGR